MKKVLLLLFVVLAAITAGCSPQEQEETPSPIEDFIVGDEATEQFENETVREIEIDAFNFGYSQEEIVLKVGEPVRIVVNNIGGNHDFVVDELNLKTPIITTGESATLEFTPETAGEYFFYCSVGNHRAAGMEGKLTIEE